MASSGNGNNLDKTLTKAPKASSTTTARLKMVKVRATWDFDDKARPGLLGAEIDDNYAYIKSDSQYESEHKKPSWLINPKSDVAVWFAQEGTNTVILYRDVAYLLLRVTQGPAYTKSCDYSYCVTTRQIMPTYTCPKSHTRGHHKRWVLKPIILPTESEEYILEQVSKAL